MRGHPVQVAGPVADTARVADAADATAPGGPPGVPDQWWVECADPFGRCRALNVLVHDGRVRVVAPPGESAVLSADQTRLLGTALAQAAARTAG